jgi:signal transduction histidine kinase
MHGDLRYETLREPTPVAKHDSKETAMSLLTSDDIEQLAPADLTFNRSDRYGGVGMSVPLEAFREEDRQNLRRLYEALTGLQAQLEASDSESTDAITEVVDDFLDEHGWRRLLDWAKAIGEPADDFVEVEKFQQVRHDIKGGALAQLVSGLQLADKGKLDAKQFSKIELRVRDHTKIMRNAIPELDPEAYERDSKEKVHEAGLIVEKWERTELLTEDGEPVDIRVEAGYEGPISDRCVEFAALDRVIYNMMNNAVERTADGSVELYLTALPESEPDHLRIVVANAIDEPTADALIGRFGSADVSGLFMGGFTTDGSGVGLSICGEFVGFAYGVGAEGAVVEGHVGAQLWEDLFVNWVHWPIVEG